MPVKAMSLVGLDVHARQTHAAVLVPDTGELAVSKLRMELSFAFVPSVEDEHFRDLVRAIEDIRGDLMRARHRLGKFLLRRGERYPGPGASWTTKHLDWLRTRRFEDACSRATFVDYFTSVQLLRGRRTG